MAVLSKLIPHCSTLTWFSSCWWNECKNHQAWDFPGGPVVKNPPCNEGNTVLIPGWRIKNPHAMWQKKKKKKNLQALELTMQNPGDLRGNKSTGPPPV